MTTHNKTIKNKFLEILLFIPIIVGTPISLVIHTFIFIIFLTAPKWSDISPDSINLLLTTIVSLEAIYLSLFIQMSVNQSNAKISVIQEDVEEIQEDVEEIQEDVEEIQEDVEEIQEDVEEIQEDVEEIQEEDDDELEKNKNNSKTIKIGYAPISNQQKINQQILKELQEIKNELKNIKNIT